MGLTRTVCQLKIEFSLCDVTMTSERSDVIGIELVAYEFLIVFHSKYAPIVHGLSANVTFSTLAHKSIYKLIVRSH
jgi:hypothetical protein